MGSITAEASVGVTPITPGRHRNYLGRCIRYSTTNIKQTTTTRCNACRLTADLPHNQQALACSDRSVCHILYCAASHHGWANAARMLHYRKPYYNERRGTVIAEEDCVSDREKTSRNGQNALQKQNK